MKRKSAVTKSPTSFGICRCGITAALIIALAGCEGDLKIDADGDATGSEYSDSLPVGADGRPTSEDGTSDVPIGDQPILACQEETTQVGESRIRRLTPLQYRNSTAELFGADALDVDLADDPEVFASALAAENFTVAAETLAPRGIALVDDLNCDTEDRACAEEFVDAVGTRAFRRPLYDDERTWLLETFDAARESFSFDESIQIVTETILNAPQFLYLATIGDIDPDSAHGLARLNEYEIASRLSYFLWDSMPDEELYQAAQSGDLRTRDGLRSQAERMLADDRARSMIDEFVIKWFELDGGNIHFSVEDVPKDEELFGAVTPEFRAAALKETTALVQRVLFEGGTVADLFTEHRAYVNSTLADFYGVDGPTSEDQWEWVELDPNERAGILTRAAFLMVYSGPRVQSPILRGTFVLRHLLCFPQPPAPPDVDDSPIENENDDGRELTIRETTDQKTSGDCQSCHMVINSIGYAFGKYDAVGSYRDTELISGLPIDDSGELFHAGNASGPVDDAVDLSAALGSSDVVQDCITEKWFEHAMRRQPVEEDTCSLDTIQLEAGDDVTLRDLIVGVVLSDAFQYVNSGEER